MITLTSHMIYLFILKVKGYLYVKIYQIRVRSIRITAKDNVEELDFK